MNVYTTQFGHVVHMWTFESLSPLPLIALWCTYFVFDYVFHIFNALVVGKVFTAHHSDIIKTTKIAREYLARGWGKRRVRGTKLITQTMG